MDYLISGHGGRYNNTGTIVVPANITLKFFVLDRQVLSNDHFTEPNAWGIFNHLIPGLKLPGNAEYIRSRVVETLIHGDRTYNYSCWNMADIELQAYSGIYVVGGGTAPINNLANEMTLEQVFNFLNVKTPTTIYWVACRSLI